MTLSELNELFELVVKLNEAKELIRSLIADAEPGAQAFKGMPRTPGVKDKVGDLGVEIAYLDEYIATTEKEVDLLKAPAEEFFETISNIQLRMMFRFRYLHGMTWKEVADKLGGRNTEDGVKSAVYRFLNDNFEDCTALSPDDAL